MEQEQGVTHSAKTVEEAIRLALEELQITEDQAIVEIVEEGSEKGFLGRSKKQATVHVRPAPQQGEDTEVYYGDDENFDGDAVSESEEQAVQFVAEILSGIGIHGKLDAYQEEDTIYIDVAGEDCGAAIGRHGETLDAISYLCTLVANRYSEDRLRVHLDIGGYRKRRAAILAALANKAAHNAKRFGRPVKMEIMNPAERRIVHAALHEFFGVSTHSEGEDPKRCVVVTPDENGEGDEE